MAKEVKKITWRRYALSRASSSYLFRSYFRLSMAQKTHLTLCKRYVTHFFRVCSFHLESLLDNLVHEVCNMWYWPLGWRCQAQVTSGGTPSNIIVIYITKKYV